MFSDVFWVIVIVTIFSAVMSPTLCWILTAKYRIEQLMGDRF